MEFVSLYVEDGKAKELNQLKGTIPDDEILQKYIEDTKRNIKLDLDGLNDDVLQYKALMSKYHRMMKENYDQIQDVGYEIFKEFEAKKPKFENKMKEFVNAAKPVNEMLKSIQDSLVKIDDWQINKLFSIVEKVANMSDKEKDIFKFLMEYGK